MIEPRVFVRPVASDDRDEFLALMQASRRLHEPWISPPLTPRAFDAYLTRMHRSDHEGLLVCRRDDPVDRRRHQPQQHHARIVSERFARLLRRLAVCRSGYMTGGLKAAVRFAFDELGLHRLEANIQPNNAPSLNLVRRCGFVNEGFSPKLLYIAGQWRDHERWAIYDRRDTLHGA